MTILKNSHHLTIACKNSITKQVNDSSSIANDKRIALNTNLVLTGILDKSITGARHLMVAYTKSMIVYESMHSFGAITLAP